MMMVLDFIRWVFGFHQPDGLVTLLKQAVYEPQLRPLFYLEFLDAEIIFISDSFQDIAVAKEKEITLHAGDSIAIKHYTDAENQLIIPVFSSMAILNKHIAPNETYVVMKALDFLLLARGNQIVLNPGEKYFKEFTAEEVDELLAITLSDSSMTSEPEYAVIIPEEKPDELLDTLVTFFARHDDVKAAYFAMVQDISIGEEQHPLIVIDIEKGSEGLVFDAMELSRPYSEQGMIIDFTILDDNADDISQISHHTEAFYQRHQPKQLH